MAENKHGVLSPNEQKVHDLVVEHLINCGFIESENDLQEPTNPKYQDRYEEPISDLMDSLDSVEMIVHLESKLNIRITNDETDHVYALTLGNFIKFISEKI